MHAADRSVPMTGRPRGIGVARALAGLLLPWMAGALASLSAHASVIVAKDFSDLAKEADRVFVGTVTRVESRWVDEEHSGIETWVTFSELVPLLGDVDREVSLRFGGGEIDGLREQIAGVPRFEVGDRVVLFVRDERSLSPVVGFYQGCFRVVDRAEGQVVLGCGGEPVFPAPESAGLRWGTSGDDGAKTIGLEEFLDRTRREIERAGRGAD